MKLKPLKPFICGIDPGVSTGVALWRRSDEKIYFSGTKDFYSVQLFLVRSFPDNRGKAGTDGINHKETVKIFIERPNKMLYSRNESTIRKEELEIMFHCGGNRRESQLLAMCLTARGFDVTMLPPIQETKWNQERFTLYTGSRKRTSEHERDAVRFAVVNANWRPKY